MKKFWKKVLTLATLATVVPVSIDHDDTTGKTTYRSLLATLSVGPNEDGVRTDVNLEMGEGVLTEAIRSTIAARKESAMFADEELTAPAPEAPAGDPVPPQPDSPEQAQ